MVLLHNALSIPFAPILIVIFNEWECVYIKSKTPSYVDLLIEIVL
jgi:hypothetical protein